MKKVNIDEQIKKLNEFRMTSLTKTFTGAELGEKLMNLGFNRIISSAIAQKCFPYEKLGKGRLYEVPKEPIHKSILVGLYNRQNEYNRKIRSPKQSVIESPENKTQEAWDTLIEAGVIKPKFNLSRLKAEYPAIYLKCLDYEIVK